MNHGFDFGVKPLVMCLGDIECPQLIHDGEPRGVGYGLLPQFGLLHEPAFVAITFQNPEKGIELFKRFRAWVDASGDSGAAALSFLEPERGGYVVCVYPEPKLLVDRCVPKHLQGETSQVISFPIMFPMVISELSDKYVWFKERAARGPFVFGAARMDGSVCHETLFIKLKADFLAERSIPEDAPEGTYFRMGRAEHGGDEIRRAPPAESADAIFVRRRKRLRTLLPVVLARLGVFPAYKVALATLTAMGYAEWQVKQAACNLVVSFRMCKCPHFADAKDSPQIGILDHLISGYDAPALPMPPDEYMSVSVLEAQIRSDSEELLRSLREAPASPPTNDLQAALRQRGLLQNDA